MSATPALNPKISQTNLSFHEVSIEQVSALRDLVFEANNIWWSESSEPSATDGNSKGSLIEKFFRDASDPQANVESRFIYLKKDKKFALENIYTRCVDTKRLLPMALADFRIQIYVLRSFIKEDKRNEWAQLLVATLVRMLCYCDALVTNVNLAYVCRCGHCCLSETCLTVEAEISP
jgi:hypothetical protein